MLPLLERKSCQQSFGDLVLMKMELFYLHRMSRPLPTKYKKNARDYMLYLSLLDVLSRGDQIPLEAYGELSLLFRSHEDLLEELGKFRPLPSPSTAYSHSSIWIFIFIVPFLLLSLLIAFEKPLDCFLLRQRVTS